MIKIQTEEQYKETITTAKEQGLKLSNNYFFPAEINRKISEGSLFFLSIDKGLLLLDDKGLFYRCYYYLSESKPGLIELDKDAVIEFPFTGEIKERLMIQKKLIEDMGFQLGRESGMMSVSPDDVKRIDDKNRYFCEMAQKEDINQIITLLNSCFNPLYSFLPETKELEIAIQKETVFVIHEGKEVAAVLLSEIEKNNATIKQVAVNPQYRRKGLGRTILDAYHKQYRGTVKLFQHWVDLKNTPAVRMYQQAGYTFTLRRANEYIM